MLKLCGLNQHNPKKDVELVKTEYFKGEIRMTRESMPDRSDASRDDRVYQNLSRAGIGRSVFDIGSDSSV